MTVVNESVAGSTLKVSLAQKRDTGGYERGYGRGRGRGRGGGGGGSYGGGGGSYGALACSVLFLWTM